MNIKQWLWIQKEGAVIGLGYGLMSVYAALGMANQVSLSVFEIVLIFPTYVSNMIIGDASVGVIVFIVPALIGMGIGILMDSLYRPDL